MRQISCYICGSTEATTGVALAYVGSRGWACISPNCTDWPEEILAQRRSADNLARALNAETEIEAMKIDADIRAKLRYAEIDRLEAALARVQALCESWEETTRRETGEPDYAAREIRAAINEHLEAE